MRRCLTTATVLLAATGCFAPSAPTGARCAPIEAPSRCPSGQECVARGGVETCEEIGASPDAGEVESDAELDAAVDGDGDEDGVLDSVDNCPDVANAMQADEDADEVGDVCDPCPPFADNTDGDNDGVGDACDPNPTTPGDKLVAFEGFTAPMSAAWTSSGSVMAKSGEGVMIAGDNASALLSMPSPAAARVEIRAGFVIDVVTASGLNLGSVNVVDRLQPNTDKAITCQLAGLADGTQEYLRIFNGSTLATIDSAARPFATGTPLELRLRRSGTSYACRVTSPALELAGSATFSPASPRIGLRVRGAAARFRWVMIVTSP